MMMSYYNLLAGSPLRYGSDSSVVLSATVKQLNKSIDSINKVEKSETTYV